MSLNWDPEQLVKCTSQSMSFVFTKVPKDIILNDDNLNNFD